MKQIKRYFHIDLIEVIAIFFVIVYHGSFYSFDFTVDSSVFTYFSYLFRALLSTCVPLFFVANGYLLFSKEFNLKKHVIKLFRIIILFFIWSIILMCCYMLLSDSFSFKLLIHSILSLDSVWNMNIFWFLGSLVSIYIVFPALKSMFDFNEKSFLFFCSIVFVFCVCFDFVNHVLSILSYNLGSDLGHLNLPAILMFNPFGEMNTMAIMYFCLGGLLFKYGDKFLLKNKMLRNVISAIGLVFSSLFLFLLGIINTKISGNVVWDLVWNGYHSIFTFFNVLFIYVLSLNFSVKSKIVECISTNTLGVYFIHILLIRLSSDLFVKYAFLCNLPFNLIYSIFILLFSVCFCMILKKIPILKRLI